MRSLPLLSYLLLVPVAATAAEPATKSLAAVKKAIDTKQAVLLDVRTKDEWDGGHLAAARHLPLNDLRAGTDATALAKLLPKGKPVYVHCAVGKRAKAAAPLLEKHGYKMHPLPHTYEDLVEAGFQEAPRD